MAVTQQGRGGCTTGQQVMLGGIRTQPQGLCTVKNGDSVCDGQQNELVRAGILKRMIKDNHILSKQIKEKENGHKFVCAAPNCCFSTNNRKSFDNHKRQKKSDGQKHFHQHHVKMGRPKKSKQEKKAAESRLKFKQKVRWQKRKAMQIKTRAKVSKAKTLSEMQREVKDKNELDRYKQDAAWKKYLNSRAQWCVTSWYKKKLPIFGYSKATHMLLDIDQEMQGDKLASFREWCKRFPNLARTLLHSFLLEHLLVNDRDAHERVRLKAFKFVGEEKFDEGHFEQPARTYSNKQDEKKKLMEGGSCIATKSGDGQNADRGVQKRILRPALKTKDSNKPNTLKVRITTPPIPGKQTIYKSFRSSHTIHKVVSYQDLHLLEKQKLIRNSESQPDLDFRSLTNIDFEKTKPRVVRKLGRIFLLRIAQDSRKIKKFEKKRLKKIADIQKLPRFKKVVSRKIVLFSLLCLRWKSHLEAKAISTAIDEVQKAIRKEVKLQLKEMKLDSVMDEDNRQPETT